MPQYSQPDPLFVKKPLVPEVNVLLVDDHPANLLALEVVLEDLGHRLVLAHSGEEALRLVQENEFAVVLLDVQMHGLDGFETAKRMRGHKFIPIIFLTAYDSHRLPVEEAYALGAVDYLVKPLVPVVLRAKVAGFVELFVKTEQVKLQAEQIQQMERREFERKLAEERQRAEEVLRDSEQRFARFMQHLPGLAWIKDLEGRYVYANEPAEIAFRTPRTHLYGKTDEEVFPPATAQQFKENDRDALASGSGVQVIETLEHEDGRLHHSLVTKFPIMGSDGRPTLVGGMAIDITDRLQAEEALKEADRRKDEFLATLAHELRNPLAPVRNAVQILMLKGPSLPELQWAMDVIDRQMGQMTRLIDDLLDISRISRGNFELRRERIEIARMVEVAVETSGPLIEAAGHTLTVTVPSEPIYLDADVTRLAQVFSNLLNNAAKYSERGGRIWLTIERQGSQVKVIVKDTGVGIPAEMLPRVFEMFTQEDKSLERSRGGLGIGLTLVKRLVDMHGGRIEARSEGRGKGSEFVVYLPTSFGAPDPSPASDANAQAGQVAPLRILVVDDNRDSAQSLGMLLEVMGHHIRTAHDGLEAVAAAAEFLPQIVFMDIGMPRLNGLDAARRIRQETWGKSMVLVAITGWGQQEDRRRTKEAGFDYHLTKPVNPAFLQDILHVVPKP